MPSTWSLTLFALLWTIAGCGQSVTPDPTRKITWEEFQQMDAERQSDPYVLDNLDDAARAKHSGPTGRRTR